MSSMDDYLKKLSARVDEKLREQGAPMDNIDSFQILTKELSGDIRKTDLGVRNYGISIRTIVGDQNSLQVRITKGDEEIDIVVTREALPRLCQITLVYNPTLGNKKPEPEEVGAYTDIDDARSGFVVSLQRVIDELLHLIS